MQQRGRRTVIFVNSQQMQGAAQTADFAIAYVKRTVPTTKSGAMAQDDLRLPRAFFAKADLYLLSPSNAGGGEKNVTTRVTSGGNWDIKDVDVAGDGTRIIFAMRGPLKANQKDMDPPNWSIWEYVIATDFLHQICPSEDSLCTGSQYISPHYLPDGRILFSSTRQFDSGSVLLNEGKPEFEGQTEDLNESAFVLHVMGADGSGMLPSAQASTRATMTMPRCSRTVASCGAAGITPTAPVAFISTLRTPTAPMSNCCAGFGQPQYRQHQPERREQRVRPGQDCRIHPICTCSRASCADGRVLALVRPFTDADFLAAICGRSSTYSTTPKTTCASIRDGQRQRTAAPPAPLWRNRRRRKMPC